MTDADPVLVLGGGLAGVACAHKLGDEGIPVVLVDRNDYHQFQPLLYQVATSQLPAEDIARPHQSIFRDYPSVQVVTAHVDSVSLGDRTLSLADGRTLTGSYVVMAAGARPNFFGIPGADEHAYPLYSVADAERLRLHLQEQVQAASSGSASSEGDGTLDVVVVGGGPTGVDDRRPGRADDRLGEDGRDAAPRARHPGRPRRRAARRLRGEGASLLPQEADAKKAIASRSCTRVMARKSRIWTRKLSTASANTT